MLASHWWRRFLFCLSALCDVSQLSLSVFVAAKHPLLPTRQQCYSITMQWHHSCSSCPPWPASQHCCALHEHKCSSSLAPPLGQGQGLPCPRWATAGSSWQALGRACLSQQCDSSSPWAGLVCSIVLQKPSPPGHKGQILHIWTQ